jgi:peptidyl-tRNA hydrolase, PTH1 family
MFLFVGLGNPGDRYEANRHNIGFMAVDEIVRRHGFSTWRQKFQAHASEGKIAGERVLVIKPQTYMNDSGQSAGAAMQFLKIDPSRVIVFYDELDLLAGKLRVKTGGGAAGHNGIRSLIAHIGADFQRVRIGIGHPGDKALVYNHVLSDFAKSDKEWVVPLLDAVAENVGLLIEGKDAPFQSKVHLAVNPPPAKPPKTSGDGP